MKVQAALGVQEVNLYRQRMRVCRNAVWEYDFQKGDLSCWFWYVQSSFSIVATCIPSYTRPIKENGERVTPSALETHRVTHHFRGPYCFCAISVPFSTAPASQESAIFLDDSEGELIGEYIAACARGICSYKGMLWNILVPQKVDLFQPFFLQYPWNVYMTRWAYLLNIILPAVESLSSLMNTTG
jgi:hypothetical protein